MPDKSAPFLKDYNPAGRLVFALTPGKTYIDMFLEIIKLTGRKLPALLVSMYYLRGARGHENLMKIRGLCDRLLVDSGVFTLRSQVLKGQEISHKIAHWKLDPSTQDRLIELCKAQEGMFDEFTEEYGQFLEDNEDVIDLAIDLDVEQMLGMDKAEEYYHSLCKHITPAKLMRVWHAYRRSWQDWVTWCESREHTWLALEGPDQHNRDVRMYSRFINEAHQHGVRVHVLATTTMNFLLRVPMDTCDSSTYTVGGRWARLIMPNGRDILVGENYKKDYGSHFLNLSRPEQREVEDIVRYFGFTINELNESHMDRCMFNALMFLQYYDKPIPQIATSQVIF